MRFANCLGFGMITMRSDIQRTISSSPVDKEGASRAACGMTIRYWRAYGHGNSHGASLLVVKRLFHIHLPLVVASRRDYTLFESGAPMCIMSRLVHIRVYRHAHEYRDR